MRFTKIRFDGHEVELRWREGGDNTRRKTEEISKDTPKQGFDAALQALVPEILSFLELPASYADNFLIRSVAIKYDDEGERRGVVVSATKELTKSNSPLNINTPVLKEPKDTEQAEAGANFSSLAFAQLIEDLITEALRYLEGHRADVLPFLAPEPEAEAADAH